MLILSMTTIALTDEVRNKLGKVNKYFNYVENKNDSLGDTIDKVLTKVIKDEKIQLN